MKISIVTPVLNGERFVRETVESVLLQKGDFELEYIVRDGGSTDGTLAILEEYAGRILLTSEPDGSAQEAINAGMAMASGDVLAWLNADDVYEPGALAQVTDALRRDPERRWCYGLCRIIDENGREIRKPITLYKTMLGWFYSRNVLLCENYVNQPATFWRRELWDEVNDLDCVLRAAWDYRLWLGMAECSRALPIHTTLARFRRHTESISESHFTLQFDEELRISAAYGKRLHYCIHALNRWKIVMIYRLLGALGRNGG